MTDGPVGPPANRTARWRPAAVAVAVAAIGVGAYAVTSAGDVAALPPSTGETTSTEPTDGSDPLSALAVREGDAVRAGGAVVDGPGEPVLCRLDVGSYAPLGFDEPEGELPAPVCSPLAVRLNGIDDLALPTWTERDGVWFTDDRVIVDGTWRDGVIEVAAVALADRSYFAADEPPPWSSEVPCSPPAGGWAEFDGLPTGASGEEVEGWLVAVAETVAAHPDRYHSHWVGYPDGDPFAPGTLVNDNGEPMIAHDVMIVSAVGDLAAAHAELAAVYPGNLCVVPVDHSFADLQAAAARMATPDGTWIFNLMALGSSRDNRIIVELPVLDEAALARIGPDVDLVKVRPLLRRV